MIDRIMEGKEWTYWNLKISLEIHTLSRGIDIASIPTSIRESLLSSGNHRTRVQRFDITLVVVAQVVETEGSQP